MSYYFRDHRFFWEGTGDELRRAICHSKVFCICCKRNGGLFMSGTFDLFNTTCKQYSRCVLNRLLNCMKNGDVGGTCKRSLSILVLISWWFFFFAKK